MSFHNVFLFLDSLFHHCLSNLGFSRIDESLLQESLASTIRNTLFLVWPKNSFLKMILFLAFQTVHNKHKGLTCHTFLCLKLLYLHYVLPVIYGINVFSFQFVIPCINIFGAIMKNVTI